MSNNDSGGGRYPQQRSRVDRRSSAQMRAKRTRQRRIIIGVVLAVVIILMGLVGWLLIRWVGETEPLEFEVVIPEGFTVEETAERVGSQSNISGKQFLEATKTADYQFSFSQEAGENLEGFLFPKTYTFAEETTPHNAVQTMLSQFDLETEELDWSRVPSLVISRYQAIIVASLVEEEAKFDDERPIIASVIYNRLRQGMKLQIDATVQYALGTHKTELSYEDLQVDSPYNTYRVAGLPPAPIASPGMSSIEAALDPADTDYLYYLVTDPKGRHSFTADYQEFLRLKEQVNK